jgi:hypothetical protein
MPGNEASRRTASGTPADSQEVRKAKVLSQPERSRIGHPDASVVKGGEVFMLSTHDGDVPWELPHPYGVYSADCRFLNGPRPQCPATPCLQLAMLLRRDRFICGVHLAGGGCGRALWTER